MKYDAILFDLDGTLLPMNQDKFIECYFKSLTSFMCAGGRYEPTQYFGAIWHGVKAMLKNDGSINNEDAYFNAISEIFESEGTREARDRYTEFYETKYQELRDVCGYTDLSRKLIDMLKENRVSLALATNPVFPSAATNLRMSWVGLMPQDFDVVTTCDNIGYSKPSTRYYLEVAKRMGADPKRCLMVGNDVSDDIPAKDVGMEVFLLTDCLINKNNDDISKYPHGSFNELFNYIKNAL